MNDNAILPQTLTSALSEDHLALLNGNNSMDRLNLVTPTYRIEYGKGDDPSLKVGHFTSSLGDQYEVINATILALSFSRQRYGDFAPGSTDNSPLCASSNGVSPGSGSSPELGPCEKLDAQGNRVAFCPYAQWREGKRPECSEVFTVLGWDWNENQLFKFSFKGASIKHLNRFKARISNARKWGYPEFPTNACVRLKLCVKQVSSWYECHMPPAGANGENYWEKLPLEEVKSLLEEVSDFICQFQRMASPQGASEPQKNPEYKP